MRDRRNRLGKGRDVRFQNNRTYGSVYNPIHTHHYHMAYTHGVPPLEYTRVYYVPHVRDTHVVRDDRGLGRGLSVEPPRQTRARRTANRAS